VAVSPEREPHCEDLHSGQATMDTSDIKKGLKFMYEGDPYVCLEFQFVKPGKGQAFTSTKMRHLLTGSVLERNIRSGEKIEAADAEERSFQYIYPDGADFVFMDMGSGEQITVAGGVVGDARDFLMDGSSCLVTIYRGNPVSIDLPPHITVEVVETEPGVKGDTASNVTKPAKIATGATVQVPLFITEGEWVKVDTRTRAYLERVKAPN
jgi:elongation factor P